MVKELPFSPNIASIWQACYTQSTLQNPFYSYEWHEAYFASLGKEEIPLILHLPEFGLIAPFIQMGNQIAFSGGKEVSDYMDLVGSENHKQEAWEEILKYLRKHHISQLVLANVPQSSKSLSFFQKLAQNAATIKITQEDTTPMLKLPNTYATYTESLPRKSRHELERKMRKFKREHPHSEIKISQQPDKGLDILFNLMRLDTRKSTFLSAENEAFFRLLPGILQQEFSLQFLYVDNIPAAAVVGFTAKSTFFLYNSGFDEEKYSGAGFYLKVASIRLTIEKGTQQYNFLQGRERYKYELGGKDFGVYEISCQFS